MKSMNFLKETENEASVHPIKIKYKGNPVVVENIWIDIANLLSNLENKDFSDQIDNCRSVYILQRYSLFSIN